MSNDIEDTVEIDAIPDSEKEHAILAPQQHSGLAHGFAQAMLMATLNKKTGRFATSVENAVKAAVHLNVHTLDPQTLNIYYETFCQADGRNNPYRDSVRITAQKAERD